MRVGLGYQQVLITFYNNLLLLLPSPPDDNDKSCKVAVGQSAPFGSSAPPRPTPPRPPKKQIALVHWRPLAAQLTLARATSTPDSRARHDTHCSQKRHSDLEWSAGGELHAGQVFGPDSRMHARRASVRPRLQDAFSCHEVGRRAPMESCEAAPDCLARARCLAYTEQSGQAIRC